MHKEGIASRPGVAATGPSMVVALSLASALPATALSTAALWPLLARAESLSAPPIMHARVYEHVDGVGDYWVSEKLDGMRAYWDGSQLLTRTGKVIHAPAWFTQGWPRTALDGELWAGRGRFEQVTATVRDRTPDEAAWRKIGFHAFDMPQSEATFSQRLHRLRTSIERTASPTLKMVMYFRVQQHSELMSKLNEVVARGGEGLMLHHSSALYLPGRSHHLLKLKPRLDAEAVVVGYEPGQGKYTGKLGALRVRRADGLEFRIGTGFSDEERGHPPAIGTVITYTYEGLTARGVPRFARYMRPSDDR